MKINQSELKEMKYKLSRLGEDPSTTRRCRDAAAQTVKWLDTLHGLLRSDHMLQCQVGDTEFDTTEQTGSFL